MPVHTYTHTHTYAHTHLVTDAVGFPSRCAFITASRRLDLSFKTHTKVRERTTSPTFSNLFFFQNVATPLKQARTNRRKDAPECLWHIDVHAAYRCSSMPMPYVFVLSVLILSLFILTILHTLWMILATVRIVLHQPFVSSFGKSG